MADSSATLTPEMQESLDKKKRLLRHDNEAYLRERPELKRIMQNFFLKVLNDKPNDNLEVYAAQFFMDEKNYEEEKTSLTGPLE